MRAGQAVRPLGPQPGRSSNCSSFISLLGRCGSYYGALFGLTPRSSLGDGSRTYPLLHKQDQKLKIQALAKAGRRTGAARKLESRKAKVEGRKEVRGQKRYCGSPMRRTSARIGL